MSVRDAPLYTSAGARVRHMRERKKKGTVLQSKGTGPAYRLVYLALCSRREKINRAVSGVMHSALPTVPISGCSRQMLQIKKGGRGRRAAGWETKRPDRPEGKRGA